MFFASPASETLLLDPYWQANKPTFQKEAFPTMPDWHSDRHLTGHGNPEKKKNTQWAQTVGETNTTKTLLPRTKKIEKIRKKSWLI